MEEFKLDRKIERKYNSRKRSEEIRELEEKYKKVDLDKVSEPETEEEEEEEESYIEDVEENRRIEETIRELRKKRGGEESESDKFLLSYVLGDKNHKRKYIDDMEEEDFLSEDSKELERVEDFETKGRGRRRGAEARREEEKREIRRLKELREEQKQERLSVIERVSGLERRDIERICLDEEYDSCKFDKLLNGLFDQNYQKRKETKRPKIEGDTAETEEIREIEEQEGVTKEREAEIRKAIKGEREMRKFEYVAVKSVDFGLSVRDILLAEDASLKKQFPARSLGPFKSKSKLGREKDSEGEGKEKRP